MIYHNLIVYDFETGSANRMKCQPLQLAAVAVDVKRLEVIPRSEFSSLICPIFDNEAATKAGLDPLQKDAMEVNKLDIEELKKAPSPKVVWEQFIEYLNNYNIKSIKGDKWTQPYRGGFNNTRFDDKICERLCETYGPKLNDEGEMIIFHPTGNIDAYVLMNTMFNYHKLSKNNRNNMDVIREYMGYKTEGAHNAVIDVTQIADLLIRFFRLNRNLIDGKINLPLGKKIKFKGCVDGKV